MLCWDFPLVGCPLPDSSLRFIDLIRDLRRLVGLTQEQFASLLGGEF